MGNQQKQTSFQSIIEGLTNFWRAQDCIVLPPYDMNIGAGTFHWATALMALGEKPWRCVYVQPSRRPADGRFGRHRNRLQHYFQLQVLLKPSPRESQQLFLSSLKAIGIDDSKHDIRFVEDNWESPTLGAWGLGWEIWCNGMEIAQFTYFQQVGGIDCRPTSTELTYGLERLAMYVQDIDNVYDVVVDQTRSGQVIRYGDLYQRAEESYSRFQLREANVERLHEWFTDHEQECQRLLSLPKDDFSLARPAYDHCIAASHIFNSLDAVGTLSREDRQAMVQRVRRLVRDCCALWQETL